jgi:AraC family transcriptional regulator of adaptative response / DNA-3-methyladenine glycosylase II
MPGGRRRALVALAEAVAAGAVVVDPGADPSEMRASLVALPGVGPWTAEYVAMRALRDPDAFMPTDLGIRRAARALGRPDDPAHLSRLSDAWRPWRSYAMVHMWAMGQAQPPVADAPEGTRPSPEMSSPERQTTKKSSRGRDAA